VVEWVNGIGVVWQLEYFLSSRKNERFLNKEAHQNWKPWLCCPLWDNKYPGGFVGFHLLQNPITEIKGRESIKIVFSPVNRKSIYSKCTRVRMSSYVGLSLKIKPGCK